MTNLPEAGSPTLQPRSGSGGSPTPDSGSSPIVLVTAGDEGFALPMAVTLHSTLTHIAPHRSVRIVGLDAGLTPRSRRRIAQVVRESYADTTLRWVQPDISALTEITIKTAARFNASIFYRLLIPEVLPASYERVLYLDSDIVAEESIEALWAQLFGDHIVLAVPERAVSCPENGIAEWERLGLAAEAPYFNSGVMLIHLDRWREADISGAALRYLTNPENRFCYPGDQEALNAVLAGRWGALAPRWNATHLLYSDTERLKMEAMLGTSLASAREDPALIHFTSDRKPWMPRCGHPLQERFFHYLRRSGWFRPGHYEAWRVRLALRDGVEWVKTMSRPLRHKIGLRHHASA